MTTAGRARGLAIVLLAAGILATGALVPGPPAARASSARPLAAQALATRALAARTLAARIPSGRTPSAPKLAPHVASRPHHVDALGGDLVDAVTGKRLWSRGLDQQRPMGSITKVMTALLVIRAGHLRRHIKITKAIPAYIRRHPGTSSAGLRPATS